MQGEASVLPPPDSLLHSGHPRERALLSLPHTLTWKAEQPHAPPVLEGCTGALTLDKVQILVTQEPPNTWKMLVNIPSVHPQGHLGPLLHSLPGAVFFSDQNSSLLWVQGFAQGRDRE